ncbi:MAG: cytochrome c [Pirellulales bacterium]|nr:cytochrome c [Planctomycetales bacterium]
MSRTKRFVITSAICAVAAAALVTTVAEGQVKKGKERPLLTEQLMEGLVAPNCGALKKALEAGPADDKAWKEVALHAALLNEASYIMMDDGRCPAADWADAAETLRTGSQAVLDAAATQNVDAGKEAFATLTKSCGACHKVYKKG